MAQLSIWRCPNCLLPLVEDDAAWRCDNNHCFDKAKQGYTNLLLANQKNSLEPGDSVEMIGARRDFLNAGYYQPLADALAEIITTFVCGEEGVSSVRHILDLGCGEGYYLNYIHDKQAKDTCSDVKYLCCHGIDISKAAVKKAASSQRQSKLQAHHQFTVASSYAIPVVDKSVDIALCVFAPLSLTEVQRVLKKDGVLVRVYPGARHLYQLKSALYEQVTLHETPKENSYFNVVEDHRLAFVVSIGDQQGIRNLLAMTPLNWHGNNEAKLQVMGKAVFDVECDFHIQLLKSNL